jgi:hypothetical protein
LSLSKSIIHIFDVASSLFIAIKVQVSSVIKSPKFIHLVISIFIFSSKLFISDILLASLASAAKP